MTGRLRRLPLFARGIDGIRIVAVEEMDRALVTFEIFATGAFDKEAHVRGIRVPVRGRQQHRLFGGIRFLVGAVRQKESSRQVHKC